jgi:hypothetical protein
MGIFSGKKYRECKTNQDGTISCLSYKPTKDGKKIVVASILAQKTPDCKAQIIDEDGNPDDLEELETYLEKKTGLNCNRASTI